ncbi:hypothetical protein HNQ94_002360 [Salirhabdus euzebyi]|uniref:Uncharacterized protein n=1 Tax=Salirhabdus euzebyi TaxID=394506 RepID=A0A841Q603_9BACI|nr:hypothetical protein [Salirhabdus euzebyi]MBB6453909.1 hypothetical protein [Salirhabdus euzebyi]
MKLILYGLVTVFLIVSGWYTFHTFSSGEFVCWSESSADLALFEEKGGLYLGYDMEWNGKGKPVLENLELVRADGTPLHSNPQEIIYTPLISDRTTGIYTVDDTKDIIFSPLKKYKIQKQKFHLVLRVSIQDKNFRDDIQGMKITYRILGQKKEQMLQFSGLITS